MSCRERLLLGLLALILPIFLFSCMQNPSPTPSSTPLEKPSGGEVGGDDTLREKFLDDAMSTLQTGKIAFNVPGQMKVDESTKVTARISKKPPGDFTEGLGDSPTVESIQVNSFLKTTLEGNDFDIKPRSPEKQGLTGKGFAEWRWEVTPQKSGEKLLTLSVYVRIKPPNEPEEEVFLKTYNK